jgi:PilZ domain-containing protein
MMERRAELRQHTNIRGVARYGVSTYEKPCTVSDLSSHGAGLTFASTFGIPSQFQLLIDGESCLRHCRVVWTDGKRLGVQFE